MTMSLTSPITGGAQTGFTSPTYTLTVDTNPAPNAKRWVILAIGGTQVGVETHTASKQFAIEVEKPAVIRQLSAPSSNGQIVSVPTNRYRVTTSKSVLPASGQLPRPMNIKTEIPIPAGSESYDIANIRAAISAHIGALNQLSAGLGDSVQSGTM